MNWQPGDKALVVCRQETDFADISGEIVTLKSKERPDQWIVESSKGAAYVREHVLQKPDDGNDLGSWDEVKKICDWTPDNVIILEEE